MDLTDVFASIGTTIIENRKRAGVRVVIADDGLEHCANCGEPLWLALTFSGPIAEKLGGTRYVPRNCACMSKMLNDEEETARIKKRLEEIEKKRHKSIPEERWRENRFAVDDGSNPKIRRMCGEYVGKWRDIIDGNYGLAFIGSNEGGKTFWASCIANALIDEGASVLMTTIPQLISDMTRNYGEFREDVLYKIRNVQFLILDDFGFERDSGFSLEKAFEIIDTRANAKRPLIITANLTEDALNNPPNMEYSRIYSRVVEMCPAIIKVDGQHRKKIAAQKRAELARLLRGE